MTVESSRLRIEVEVPHPDPNGTGPCVRWQINGDEPLAAVFPEGVGADPDGVIGLYSPLRPHDVPRDVALMRCACGSSECELLVANVRRVGDQVVWGNFRLGPGTDRLRPVEVSPVRFEAVQYLTELERADAERDWETPARTTGRLVREGLTRARAELERVGFTLETTRLFEGAQPSRLGLAVTLIEHRGDARRLVELAFEAGGADPNERAADAVRTIMQSPTSDWPIAFQGEWTPDDDN